MQLDGATTAVGQGDWGTALRLLDELGDEGRSVEALELRALASYGDGQFEASVSAREAIYALLLARGDRQAAAHAAATIAMYLMMDTGLMAPVRGWLHRAERLLDGDVDTPARALIAMVRTYERFMSGDLVGAKRDASLAIELGTRWGVAPAVVIGRVASARVRILDGDVEGGLADLDEIAVLLMSGEIDALTTGMMYCELICAAQGLALHDRAAEWTDVMEHWRHRAAHGGINGRCRVHRAEVLRVSGPCSAAEEEALGACDELRPWMRREYGWPLAELGAIRLRKGDLVGAEEALLAAHAHAWCPQPALALLRLAQGDADAAAELIAEAIEHPLEIPSKERPPFTDLRLAPLLEAQVEIAAARGDAETAATAAHALAAVADRYPSRSLAAAACLAHARSSLLEGSADAAIESAQQSVAAWIDLGAPYDAACARMVLAEAYRRAGHMNAATLELQAAGTAFRQYGAVGRASAVADLEAGQTVARAIVRAGGRAVFSCDSDLRTVEFGGEAVVVRDLIGLRYLERLLASPGREIHVLDLVAVERGSLPTATVHEGLHSSDGGMPVIDEQARQAYRRRLVEVEDDIDEAERLHDTGRAERAHLDRDYLLAELSRAVGLGGRLRSVGSDTERARSSVARSIRYAIGQLRRHHEPLAAHLERSVRTGAYCVYEPDPSSTVVWAT